MPASSPQNEDVIDSLVKHSLWVQDQHGAVQPRGELPIVVQVRVIDERAGPGRREAHHESVPRPDHWCCMIFRPTPAVNPVVSAFQFHSVPMNRRCFGQVIDQRDSDWLTAPEHDHWAGHEHRYSLHKIAKRDHY